MLAKVVKYEFDRNENLDKGLKLSKITALVLGGRFVGQNCLLPDGSTAIFKKDGVFLKKGN